MKTHELARALTQLAKLLRSAPNVGLSGLDLVPANSLPGSFAPSDTVDLVSLHAFVELSRVPKAQWLVFIEEHDLPLTIRRRDATRDILFKVAAYLETDSDARRRLRDNINKTRAKASPELMKALGTLLKD